MAKKVKKLFGENPEDVNVLNQKVSFDENGEAEVEDDIADILSQVPGYHVEEGETEDNGEGGNEDNDGDGEADGEADDEADDEADGESDNNSEDNEGEAEVVEKPKAPARRTPARKAPVKK